MGKRFKTVAALCLLSILIMQGKTTKAETGYPYLIKVNRQQCTITIYEKDKKGEYSVPIRAMLCSPGWDTPLGSFKTPEKYRWRLLMGDVWGQYSTRINKGVLFHSVWYYDKDPSTLSNIQFNKLGTVCSHGCVRVNVEDAKWIYDNCPVGTTVTI
ncbi:MAG: L,D-transpeptidase, partial [Acetivibrio sp.]